MSAATVAASDSRTSGLLEELNDCLDELSCRFRVGCVLALPDGRVAGHVLPAAAPGVVANAVLAGRVGSLDMALRGRRAHGLVNGRPAVQGLIVPENVEALVVPIGKGDLWLVGAESGELTLEELADPVARLVTLLETPMSPAGMLDGQLLDCLWGATASELPLPLRACRQFRVAALARPDAAAARALSRACREASQQRDLLTVSVTCPGEVLIVVGARRQAVIEHAVGDLERVVAAAALLLGRALSVAVSAVVNADELPRARVQAQAAAACPDLLEPGCTPFERIRSAIVLRMVAGAITTLPDLGPDPVSLLLEHDRRRRTDLGSTLLAWLEAQGDCALAAQHLSIHPNTLRYRLRRVREVSGLDLGSASARLEAHLRLRASA